MGRRQAAQLVRGWPWSFDGGAVASELGTDAVNGLSTAEAATRLRQFGPNQLEQLEPVPGWRKLLDEFRTPLVYLLIVAAAISLVTWVVDGDGGVPFEAVVITVILVANAVLGYVQQAKADEAVAALGRMSAPVSSVVRDAVKQRIPAEQVVPGDVLLLAEGDTVSADARLLEAASLTVIEAALTGESAPVLKDAGRLEGVVAVGDRVNMVFAGTAVAQGRGRAVVTGTGMDTEMGDIASLLESTAAGPTPLQREIDVVGRTLGVAVILIALVVMVAIVVTFDIDGVSDVVDVLLLGVALAVAAVPEGLPAVLTVVLALGVQRMARERAIVKQLSSVETLGSATVICTDKTGTLTRNEMTLQRIVTHSAEVQLTGSGYTPIGEVLAGGKPVTDGAVLAEIRAVVSGGSLASDASLHLVDGEWSVHGDPTEVAFLVAERKAGLSDRRAGRFHRVGEVPFTSDRKLMSTLQVDDGLGGGVVAMTKGAPDVLLARCTHERVGHGSVPLGDARREEILAAVDRLADDALRTLAVAYRQLGSGGAETAGEEVEHDMVFAGVAGLIDPPRDEARTAIAEAHQAGIRVLMITGDHPRTAHRIAVDLGIEPAEATALTGAEVAGLDADGLRHAVRKCSVFARVAPEHKLRIVDALRTDGNVVCMTGDGVNDAPALKAADIGVAMGISGTDVTKEAADLILADDNFATIVAAVREGRGIFANIRTFLRYLLSSNTGEVLTMLLGIVGAGVLGLSGPDGALVVPLLATQVLWINLLTDTAPALAMGLDPPPDDVMSRPPRRTTDGVIDASMIGGIVFVGSTMAAVALLAFDIGLPGGLVEGHRSVTEARTLAFTTLVLAQLIYCFSARSDRAPATQHLFTNPLLWGAIGVSLLLQVAVVHVPLLQQAFGTEALDVGDWLLCAVLAFAAFAAEELRKLAARTIDGHRKRPVRATRDHDGAVTVPVP